MIYAANVSEDDLADGNHWVEAVRTHAESEYAQVVVVSAQVEAELLEIPAAERADFLEALGVSEGGLQSLIRATYDLLGLRTYFTTGPEETRAWTIKAGCSRLRRLALFILILSGALSALRRSATKTWLRRVRWRQRRKKVWCAAKGKEYTVKEGDVMLFRFNV